MTEKHKNEEFLREQYWQNEKSLKEIGEMVGESGSVIRYYMEKNDIDRREPSHNVGGGSITISQRGYAKFQISVNGELKSIPMHRLNALLKTSLANLKNKDVHHKNHVRWDNRPENLEVLTKQEHNKQHLDPW